MPLSLAAGEWSEQGKRPYQEDVSRIVRDCTTIGATRAHAVLLGLYDGHGGPLAAEFVAQALPERLVAHDAFPFDEDQSGATVKEAVWTALRAIDDTFCARARREALNDGTTALMCLIHDTTLHVCNIGDTRCVLGRIAPRRASYGARNSPKRGVATSIEALRLSRDHRPTDFDEKARVIAAGGRVLNQRAMIANCRMSLSVTRCVGDVPLKDAGQRVARARHAPAPSAAAAKRKRRTSGGEDKEPATSTEPSTSAPAHAPAGTCGAQGASDGMAAASGGAAAPPARARDFLPDAPTARPPELPRAAELASALPVPAPAPPPAAAGAADARHAAHNGVICVEPHVHSRALESTDRFLVLGTDGLFDALEDDECARIVTDAWRAQRLRHGLGAGGGNDSIAEACAHALVRAALDGGSMDNVTAQVVLLLWPTEGAAGECPARGEAAVTARRALPSSPTAAKHPAAPTSASAPAQAAMPPSAAAPTAAVMA